MNEQLIPVGVLVKVLELLSIINVTVYICSLFQVFLGDPHSCTCTSFMKDRDLCKHICWLILKKFRVPQNNPGINLK